jgi:hypothetical protein
MVDRHELQTLLRLWEEGKHSERDVHEEAERLWEMGRPWPEYPEEDDRSIAVEVLSQLDILNHQLITREDIPAMLTFLSTPPDHARQGWSLWRDYWTNIDFARRREQLADNPYYIASHDVRGG